MALTGSLVHCLGVLFWIVCLLSAVSTARTGESRPGEKEKLGGSLKPLDKDDGSAQLQSVPVIEPPQPAQQQPNKDLSSSESSTDIEEPEDESSPVPAKHPRGQKRPQQQPKERLPSQKRSDNVKVSSNEPVSDELDKGQSKSKKPKRKPTRSNKTRQSSLPPQQPQQQQDELGLDKQELDTRLKNLGTVFDLHHSHISSTDKGPIARVVECVWQLLRRRYQGRFGDFCGCFGETCVASTKSSSI